MSTTNSVRNATVAIVAFGVVLFSLNGLDSTLKPSHYAHSDTIARVTA